VPVRFITKHRVSNCNINIDDDDVGNIFYYYYYSYSCILLYFVLLFSFEGGFNTQSSEGTKGQELFSPLLRFPGESVTKLYKKMTDERLIIDVEGILNENYIEQLKLFGSRLVFMPA
jgi:hypothetical protein